MIHKIFCDLYFDFYDAQRVLCVIHAMQKGFSSSNLFYMIRSAEVCPDEQIVSALKRQLSWTHFREIIHIKDDLKRDFYNKYLTDLPPIHVLEVKLHEAIRMAREQIAVREVSGLEGAK